MAPTMSGGLRSSVGGGRVGSGKSVTTISTIAIKAGDKTRVVLAILRSNDWVQLRIDEMHPHMLDTGNNLAEAEALQRQHADLMARLASKQDQIQDLLSQADRLVLEQAEPEAAVYEAMADSLGTAWKDLNRQLALRTALLEEAVRFFTSVDQHGQDMDALERNMKEGLSGVESKDQIQRIVEEHNRIRQKILETATSATSQGQVVIGRIRELGPIVDNPDRPRLTQEAVSRIEDVIMRLNERRKRVEIAWEDRLHLLEAGMQASDLWRDLRAVEEWLGRAEERARRTNDLGTSEANNESLSRELESELSELRIQETSLGSVFHLSDQLSRQGVPEATEIRSRASGLRDRLAALAAQLETRRQVLLAAGHFFSAASKALQSLDVLQSDLKQRFAGSLSRKPEAAAAADAEAARRIADLAGPPIGQGRAVLARLTDPDGSGAAGVRDRLRELEERRDTLDQLCTRHREAAMARSRAMLDFDANYSNLHLWLLNVAEAFLATYRDMGTTLPASNDFIERHKTLYTDIQNKEADVMSLVQKAREVQGQPGDPDYQDVSSRLDEFQSRWNRLKSAVDRRIAVGHLYSAFHKAAQDLSQDMEKLDALLQAGAGGKLDERELEELWARVSQGYSSTRHQGEKFLSDSRAHRCDEDLDIRRAQLCVENILESLADRHRLANERYNNAKTESARMKEFTANWGRFSQEVRVSLDSVTALEREAAGAFGHFEDTPVKVADRIQNAVSDFLPRAKNLQQDIENKLRRAEGMDVPEAGRSEKERLISEIMNANQRLIHIITWFDVLGTQLVTFFRNLSQLDDWIRRVENKFSDDTVKRMDAQTLDDLVREHEGARQSVSTMIKFAHNEGDQIILRARQPEVPKTVQMETEKLPNLLNSRVRNWEEMWTKQHRTLTSVSSTARVIKDIRDILVRIDEHDTRLVNLKRQATSSSEGRRMAVEEFREFERSILELDIRVRNMLSMISTRPYATDVSVSEEGETLRRRWDELKARTQGFHTTLETSAQLFQLLEETETWCTEVTEYVRDVGREAQTLQSSEATDSLVARVDAYTRPKVREQEDRMHRINSTAVQLYGEDAAHRTDGVKRRFKEIVDNLVQIQDNLASTANAWRKKELTHREQNAPKFAMPLQAAQVTEGQPFVFSCTVAGRPLPQATWYKDGVPVVHNPDYKTTQTSEGVCTLRIEETFTEDSGVFLCRATNEYGASETQATLTVKESPLARMQPPDFTRKLGHTSVQAGQPVLLEAHVSAQPSASVSWFKEEQCVDEVHETSYNNGICTLRIRQSTEKDGGTYICRASNPAGQAATSASVSVHPAAEPPVFHRYLADASILAGDRLRLSATVSGKPQPELQWWLGSRPLDAGSASISYDGHESVLIIDRASTNCQGTYKLAGEAVSTCHVNVTDVEANKPKFQTELRNLTVLEGSVVRLDSAVSGTPRPEITWWKDEAPLIQTDTMRVVTEGDHHGIFFPSIKLTQSGDYKCVARSQLGEAVSICRLTVTKRAEAPKIMPTLQSQTLTTGNRCMLEARVTADPPPKITWYHNEQELRQSSSVQMISDGEWQRLVIPRVELGDSGDYCLLATNDGGEARSICNLNIVEPPPARPPPAPAPAPVYRTTHSETVEEYSSERLLSSAPHGTPPEFRRHFPPTFSSVAGSRVKLECHLVGNPRPKVTWTFNGRPIPQGFTQQSNIGDNYAVIIPEVGPEHQGIYALQGVNEMGSARTECTLTVEESYTQTTTQIEREQREFSSSALDRRSEEQRYETSRRSEERRVTRPDVAAPHFTQTLVSVVASEGEDVVFTATVTGKPTPELTWSKDGRPLGPDSRVSVESVSGDGVRLRISGALTEHSGKYVCTARNAAGFATSSAQLVVRPKTDAPDFIERLISREVGEGESMKWTVEVSGVPPPTVTWLRNGAVIPNCQDVQLMDEGRGRHSLYIPRVELVDGGQFTVRAENAAGEARSTADLVIRPKGQAPGQYYHVTKVTQEQQEVGMEVSGSAHYEHNSRRSTSRPL